MDLLNTEKALAEYIDIVIASARKNLVTQDKNASGSLSKSLKNTGVKFTSNGIEAGVEMNRYGEFIDKGVSGIKKKYNTPYSYKSKMPPPSKLDKWVVRRGIAPRDKEGKFLPRKSVLFLIARGIYRNGIKPSLFLTKPFEKMRKDLPVKLVTAFREDAKVELKTVFEQ
jgi:hypothetical protein